MPDEVMLMNKVRELELALQHTREELAYVREAVCRPQVKFSGRLTRASDGASGYDLHAAKGGYIPYGQQLLVRTGVHLAMPYGLEAQVRSRSGLAQHGISVANGVGTIDSDYRGEVCVLLRNHNHAHDYHYAEGDRIAQLVFCFLPSAILKQSEITQDTERGADGFGSTGVK